MIQDLPGRRMKGYGIPTGGPMDNLSPQSKISLVIHDYQIELTRRKLPI